MRGGWFHTGDTARIDEDGYVFIVDRKKDMILGGGYNVYPREVEEVLYEHPAVSEAAVIGLPDERMGEEVGAAIALDPGAEADADDPRDFVRQRVAAHKYPRRIWFVDELPTVPRARSSSARSRCPTASRRRASRRTRGGRIGRVSLRPRPPSPCTSGRGP
jgi:long-chain acyl-CoA synthetase